MLGLATALGLAFAAQGQRPIRAGCIDARPLFAPVELRGRLVELPSTGGGRADYDLVLDRTICADNGAGADPDQRLARIGVYATDRAIAPRLHAFAGRQVRIRGLAFITVSLLQPGRPIIVVNLQTIMAAGD